MDAGVRQYGSAILQFDATGDNAFLELGRSRTVERMAPHLTHIGVHDHGFNNVSTYGNLRRLMNEGRLANNAWERNFYELALKCSGAVQASRWTYIANGEGFIHSFNGPHSLFADTIRSLRALALSHQLGHVLMGEKDVKISLLRRLIEHARSTASFVVYHGEGRDAYDVRGRVAHESIFNVNDGHFRCPNSQQGYSPFTTWTRGLAWIMCGYAEQLEFIATLADSELEPFGGRAEIEEMLMKAARASCDFYIEQTRPWTAFRIGTPARRGCTSSAITSTGPRIPSTRTSRWTAPAAAIAAQGLLRLGHYLAKRGDAKTGKHYFQAGLTVAEPPLRRDVSQRRRIAPRADFAFGLSSPERLGLHPARAQSALRRIEHVGRLPRARTRALHPALLPIENQPYLTFFGPDSSKS